MIPCQRPITSEDHAKQRPIVESSVRRPTKLVPIGHVHMSEAESFATSSLCYVHYMCVVNS